MVTFAKRMLQSYTIGGLGKPSICSRSRSEWDHDPYPNSICPSLKFSIGNQRELMAAQDECTKYHHTACFQEVNCTLCDFHFD